MKEQTVRRMVPLLLALLLALALALLPTAARAEGEFGINADGVLTAYTGPGGDVVVPDGVTEIGMNAFRNNSTLTSVTLPDGVTSIGSNAFEGCTALQRVTIGAGVSDIGSDAFQNCAALTQLSLPDSIEHIYSGAFAGCDALGHVDVPARMDTVDNYTQLARAFPGRQLDDKYYDFEYASYGTLIAYKGPGGDVVIPEGTKTINNAFKNNTAITSVTFPAGITQIGNYSGCTSLQSVTIPDGVTTLGRFSGCTSLRSVTIPDSVTRLDSFSGCTALEAITIPGSVTTVGSDTFSGCTALRSVTLSEGVGTIQSKAFLNCESLTELSLPESLTRIEAEAFSGCTALRNVRVPFGVDRRSNTLSKAFPEGALWAAEADFTFDGTTVKAYRGAGGAVVIPDGITEIAYGAFQSQTAITSATIPDSVTKLGGSAFRGCTGLTRVTLPAGLTAIPDRCFAGCSALTDVRIPDGVTEIGAGAFNGCAALKAITLPAGLNTLCGGGYAEGGAFRGCTALTAIDIPGGVTEIGESTFQGCTALMEVTLHSGVEAIGKNAFSECKRLARVALPNTLRSIGERAFYGCAALTDIALPAGVTELATDAFDGSGVKDVTVPDTAANNPEYFHIDENGVLTYYDGPGGDLVIPAGVKEISSYVFSRKTALRSVVIPASVTKIGQNAFYNATGLQEVVFEGASVEFGGGVFNGCTALEKVTLPYAQTALSNNLFNDCSALTEITIPATVTELGVGTFSGCASLKQFTIPAGVTRIENALLSGCKALTEITIPDTVTYIGDNAFGGTGIETIRFPDSVTEVGGWAFGGCENLRSIYLPKGYALYRGGGFNSFSSIVWTTPHLDVIDENPSPVLANHMAYSAGIREAWKNMACPAQSARVQEVSNQICAGLTSDYDKLKAISEWVCKHLEYDEDLFYQNLKTYAEVPFTPDEILDSGAAVCAGYARMTQALCNAQGIPCLYVLGYVPQGYHAWNLAYADGRYVWLDNTWGMRYFDVGEAIISIEHCATGGTVFTDPNDRVAGRVNFTRTQPDVSVDSLIQTTQDDQESTENEQAPDDTPAVSEAAVAAADTLHALGLFQGTGTQADGTPKFALEREPNRYEAVTMLVRLLGKEDEAKAGTWDIPFTDIPADHWSRPYVGYAYAHGLTTGKSTTAYAGTSPVKETEYLTFVLRAMGYDDKADTPDFRWDAARTLTDALGITAGDYGTDGKYLRADVALVSLSALNGARKAGGTLAAQLVAEGVFTAQAYEAAGLGKVEPLPEEPAKPEEQPAPEEEPKQYAADDYSPEAVLSRMLAMKTDYPEGMRWTNENHYKSGAGCAGFAFLLSDAAFGERPMRVRYGGDFTFADLRSGDILRINNNSHSVVILTVNESTVTIAEGNFNSAIHWGRTLSRATAESADYVLTRYPEG